MDEWTEASSSDGRKTREDEKALVEVSEKGANIHFRHRVAVCSSCFHMRTTSLRTRAALTWVKCQCIPEPT